jgi:hypothetical protein
LTGEIKQFESIKKALDFLNLENYKIFTKRLKEGLPINNWKFQLI